MSAKARAAFVWTNGSVKASCRGTGYVLLWGWDIPGEWHAEREKERKELNARPGDERRSETCEDGRRSTRGQPSTIR